MIGSSLKYSPLTQAIFASQKRLEALAKYIQNKKQSRYFTDAQYATRICPQNQ